MVLLGLLGPVMGCTGPVPRENSRDADMAHTRELHDTPARPKLNNGSKAAESPRSLSDQTLKLASRQPLVRMQAANCLRQAGPEGVRASLVACQDASLEVAARNLEFLASIDLDLLSPELQASLRTVSIGALKQSDRAIRGFAAKVMEVHGAGDLRTEFLTAVRDPDRIVRWSVVARFSHHPRELENAQLLVLVSFLDDAKLSSDIRADVFGLLLAVFERLSKGKKPASYDPYQPAGGQRDGLAAWAAWARSVK